VFSVRKNDFGVFMDYQFMERLTTPGEYNFLREKVGWSCYDEAVIASFIKNSLYCVCAQDREKIIGMGRVIGDGGLCFYIQDIIVLPEYQGRGIGRGIMDRVMDYIYSHCHNNSIIGLMSAQGKESFYEKYGFFQRPSDKFGSGMTQFYKNPAQ
jgi:GNAT superfamily N-acetyltransferase